MIIIMCEDNMEYAKENLRIVKSFLGEEDIDCTVQQFSKYEDVIQYIKSLEHLEECLYILDVGLKGEKNGLSLGREIRDIDGYKGEMIFVTGYGHTLGTVFKLKLRVLDFIDKGPRLESDLKDALKVFLKIYRDKMENNALVFKDG
ncbi:MAG: DNA-binding response regulator, partial [Pseudomonadota bacterium]